MKKFGRHDPKTMLKLFDSNIVPILVYASEIWGVTGFIETERVASQFYRMLLGLRKNAPVTLVRSELGRHSLGPHSLGFSFL